MRKFAVGIAYGLLLFGAGYCMGSKPDAGMVSDELAKDAIRAAYRYGQERILVRSLCDGADHCIVAEGGKY